MQVAALATADLLASGSGLSDEEVVARVRSGDTPLFELLMRRHTNACIAWRARFFAMKQRSRMSCRRLT
jgi:hypothetical protein